MLLSSAQSAAHLDECSIGYFEAGGNRGGRKRNSEGGRGDPPVPDELGHHPRHTVYGYCEANARRGAGVGEDRRVYADDPASRVEKGASAVTRVDCRVCLDAPGYRAACAASEGQELLK